MRVRFVKRNDEYSDKYKIKTSLIEHDGILEFRKAPLTDEAYNHLLNMYNSQNKLIESFPLLKICSCKLLDNKEISFEYIEGKTLTEIISNAVDNGDKDKVLEILSIFKSLIYNDENICSFKMTDEFRNIFGDCIQFEGVEALKFTSLDILPNNIIFDGKDYVLIDYEWCVDFPVPIDILMYRFYNAIYKQNKKIQNMLNEEEILELLTIKDVEMLKMLDELFCRTVANEVLHSFHYRYSKNAIHIGKIKEEIDELQKSISWHEDRYKGLEVHKDFLNNQIEELQKSISWHEDRYKGLDDYKDFLNNQIEELKKSISWHEDRYKGLEEHKDFLNNQIEELKKSISWHEDRYKGLEAHKDFLNNQIEELNKSIHLYQERTKSLEDYLDILNKQITYINKHPIKYFIKKILKKLKIKL